MLNAKGPAPTAPPNRMPRLQIWFYIFCMKVIRRWRRKRTDPTLREVNRVQQALERDPAARRWLGPKTAPARSRSGDRAYFSPEALSVAESLMSCGCNPERVALRQVLAVAVRLLCGLSKKDSDDAKVVA